MHRLILLTIQCNGGKVYNQFIYCNDHLNRLKFKIKQISSLYPQFKSLWKLRHISKGGYKLTKPKGVAFSTHKLKRPSCLCSNRETTWRLDAEELTSNKFYSLFLSHKTALLFIKHNKLYLYLIMDVFGKTSTETKKMSPLQMELSAKIRERNSQGLGADLTETEEDDDDLLSMFNKSAKSSQQRSQSPYESELRKTPPKPQARVSIGTKDANTKQKVQIKPKNELDRLLMDDNEEADMLSTQKKPWQPPQFKQFSAESEVSRAPQPKERVRSSPLANPRHQSSLLEESEGSDDDELTGAYTRQLQQRTPPLGRKTPTNDGRNSIDKNELQRSISGKQGISGSGRSTPKSREDGYGLISSGRTTPKQDQLDQIRSERNSPGSGRKLLKSKEDELFGPQGGGSGRTAKSKEDELFGPQRSGSGRTTPKSREDELLISKSKKPSSNLDDIFGKRKSPSDQSLFANRKSPRELERENPERSKFKSKENDSRLTPKSELSERKSSKQSTMDDIFGVKKKS
ncbi:hypothetical protein EB796_013495 [Bugula neritina]|uniref:Uncharacterized protein n=1 Tax=Bugula neritina TaxID=10212 RepID=A0A7J7JQQ3_BUGNE|nr:hypothetical protein EB796_013495 [Bugula neritina]